MAGEGGHLTDSPVTRPAPTRGPGDVKWFPFPGPPDFSTR